MSNLIDKAALVAEIESKFQKYWKMGEESDALQDGNAKYWGGVLSCLNEVKTLIDTLEVKEIGVDLGDPQGDIGVKWVQEEPVSRTHADIEAAMQEVEEKSMAFTEAHQGEDTDTILAQMRGEEPVSNDLEAAAKNVGQKYFPDEDNIWARPNYEAVKAECAFMDGAKWQKANLWKPANGDDLPEIDKEVIVLQGVKNPVTTDSMWGCEVAFAHRPNPNGWDGKSITTGKVEHYDVQTYGKGGWNIPDVVFWLDIDLPKMEEGL